MIFLKKVSLASVKVMSPLERYLTIPKSGLDLGKIQRIADPQDIKILQKYFHSSEFLFSSRYPTEINF